MNDEESRAFCELTRAAIHDQKTAMAIIAENPRFLDLRNRSGETPLHYLAIEGCAEAVRFLASQGADVNSRDHSGSTPLMAAVSLGNSDMVRLLLGLGAEPNLQNQNGESALHICTCGLRENAVPLARMLLEAGSDPRLSDGLDGTALHCAAERADIALASVFLEAGVDVNTRNDYGQTPLRHMLTWMFIIERAEAYAFVLFLIHAGADVTIPDNDGVTPLHLAAARGLNDIVEALVATGADANARNEAGETPFDYMRKSRYLKDDGAKAAVVRVLCGRKDA
jgi:ankyrin repeat protein